MLNLSKGLSKKYTNLRAAVAAGKKAIDANTASTEDLEAYKTAKAELTKMVKKYTNKKVDVHAKKRKFYSMSISYSRANVCTLNESNLTFKAGGGGYCKSSTVLAKWVNAVFKDELNQFNQIQVDNLYACDFDGDDVYVRPGTGERTIEEVLTVLGFSFSSVYDQSTKREGVIGYEVTPL